MCRMQRPTIYGWDCPLLPSDYPGSDCAYPGFDSLGCIGKWSEEVMRDVYIAPRYCGSYSFFWSIRLPCLCWSTPGFCGAHVERPANLRRLGSAMSSFTASTSGIPRSDASPRGEASTGCVTVGFHQISLFNTAKRVPSTKHTHIVSGVPSLGGLDWQELGMNKTPGFSKSESPKT